MFGIAQYSSHDIWESLGPYQNNCQKIINQSSSKKYPQLNTVLLLLRVYKKQGDAQCHPNFVLLKPINTACIKYFKYWTGTSIANIHSNIARILPF